ncbi:PTS IIA-like nitrogen regulatory protein PtsN [Kingella sp. (in: b-proteobacteria)]|uniref:PTS IIA-like nitrogen regulatory protein PtsN n=1 Tax=Kingella sp. (in: b-proteobacteria) TaxID=2020713 RepID=UPI0026DC8A32|nr:PTS IIA-like nitrogen regulatory protein PtsN [Kingella sp. (in: b-proteobacteria)]MDO4658323.1 PTS IIA-like nitrogen regulatory protein PtsN [Kingella sp. (in: b-proteobacteria)]
MISLSDILPVSHIILDAETSSKKRLFECVAQLFAAQSGLPQSEIFDCLVVRERLGSTALGQGVAMPHGRHASVSAATGAFIRLKEPIEFDAPDNKPVSLVFVLLVPEAATSEHLELLAHLAGRFSEKSVRDALQSCGTPEAARDLLLAA